jgi:hypothetical protein
MRCLFFFRLVSAEREAAEAAKQAKGNGGRLIPGSRAEEFVTPPF